MTGVPPGAPGPTQVRAAELVAALCLATDLGMAFPWQHGFRSAGIAMALCDRLGIHDGERRTAYYVSLLTHSGCTTDTIEALRVFGRSTTESFVPRMRGSQREQLAGLIRSIPDEGAPPWLAVGQLAVRLPRTFRGGRHHMVALCEVGEMLAHRLGLPSEVRGSFFHLTERYDGRSRLRRSAGEGIPLGVRVALVARDAAYLEVVSGVERTRTLIRQRAGRALDPGVAHELADHADDVLGRFGDGVTWQETLDLEPDRQLEVAEAQLDDALSAIGDFADLISPSLAGHSSGVAVLAEQAARDLGMGAERARQVRRAGYVQDVGRVGIHPRIWEKPGALTADEYEQVRLHPYYSERILSGSEFLRGLGAVAGCHHERLDGSGYHKGATAPVLPPEARVLAAADLFRTLTQPRPHRAALPAVEAAQVLIEDARRGRLDADAVDAVLRAAGESSHGPIARPCGLTTREVQVLGLVARGLATKQLAKELAISPKTADHHIENAYRKIGVSSRAAATLFAMQHGIVAWGEIPIDPPPTGT
jgi:HD-GYP domain-containing protein (c-di-GMP phosphodiesterase class II)